MAGSYNSQSNPGAFVASTNIWDVGEIYSIEGLKPELQELLVRLYQNLNLMSLALNLKDTGYYSTQEFLNSQAFFPNPNSPQSSTPVLRQAFRTTVDFGTLPNATTISVQHNIDVNEAYTFTRIYACATQTNATSFIPIPYTSNTANQNIELYVDDEFVYITTADDWSSYTTCYVVLEYIKQ